MNTKAKAILASTLLTALFAGQSAIAGQDIDGGFFDTEIATVTQDSNDDKVNYSSPNTTISPELDAELFPEFEGE